MTQPDAAQNQDATASQPLPPQGYYQGYYPLPKEEINLAKLFAMIWQGKWIIAAFTLVFAVGAVIYALSLDDIYRAEARLVPAQEAQGGGMSSMAGQLGGLASLAGVQLSRGQVGNAALAVETLRSRQFLSDFIERREIMADLMAVEEWQRGSGELQYSSETYDAETQSWVAGEPPSLWLAVNEMRKKLSVTYDEVRGFASIAVEHASPEVAKNWVDWLITDVNNEIRQQDIQEALRSREYLEQELTTTRLASMQQVFYQLVEKQIHTIMMANVRPEYAFRVIDPAVVPEEKAAPARALICILLTFLGGVIGFLVVFVRFLVRHQH